MDSAVQDGVFQHEPLPNPRTHFRLLKIIQGGFDKHVVCELSIWPINEAPPYIAISYVWGDPACVSTITINSSPVTVRTNCEYVLQQQASAADTCQYYFWLDAVCIDQQNETEKNHQVALMGKLYSAAMHVHACIGPHCDDSRYLLEVAGPANPFLARLHQNVVYHTPAHARPPRWATTTSDIRGPWLRILCLLTIGWKTRKRLLQAFVALLNRPYFTRVWILQELFLGKDVSLCCGDTRQPISYMLAFDKLTDIWTGRAWVSDLAPRLLASIISISAEKCKFPRRVARLFPMDPAINALRARRGCLVLADSNLSRYPAPVVLDAMEDFECMDKRDRIYGTLSLVDWKDDSAPFPDYSKERFQLAAETLTTIISRTQIAVERSYVYARPTEPSMMAIAARLRTSLCALPDEGGMRTAIEMRRQSSPPNHSEHVNLLARLKRLTPLVPADEKLYTLRYRQQQLPESGWVDEDWQGVRLSFPGSVKSGPVRVEWHSLDADPSESKVSYFYCGDDVIAYGPRDTVEGDWILWHTTYPSVQWNPTIKDSNVAIIIRPLPNGTHGVVGHVYLIPKRMGHFSSATRRIRPQLKQFDIYWHAEDLLLMEWHSSEQRPSDPSLSDVREWLQMRICVEQGSSFAKGPHDVFEPVMYLSRK
jgi:hypothetical protein